MEVLDWEGCVLKKWVYVSLSSNLQVAAPYATWMRLAGIISCCSCNSGRLIILVRVFECYYYIFSVKYFMPEKFCSCTWFKYYVCTWSKEWSIMVGVIYPLPLWSTLYLFITAHCYRQKWQKGVIGWIQQTITIFLFALKCSINVFEDYIVTGGML